jgi:hypothetical protein
MAMAAGSRIHRQCPLRRQQPIYIMDMAQPIISADGSVTGMIRLSPTHADPRLIGSISRIPG